MGPQASPFPLLCFIVRNLPWIHIICFLYKTKSWGSLGIFKWPEQQQEAMVVCGENKSRLDRAESPSKDLDLASMVPHELFAQDRWDILLWLYSQWQTQRPVLLTMTNLEPEGLKGTQFHCSFHKYFHLPCIPSTKALSCRARSGKP